MNPMTREELSAALATLGLSLNGAARFLGIAPSSVRNWVMGKNPVSPPAELLLRYMVARGLSPDDVLDAVEGVSDVSESPKFLGR
jgi:DNA-binding transcriptional regulator YiaG